MNAQQLKALYPIYPEMDFKTLSANEVVGSTLVRKKFKGKFHLILVKQKSISLESTKTELHNAAERNLKSALFIDEKSYLGELGYSYPIDDNQAE